MKKIFLFLLVTATITNLFAAKGLVFTQKYTTATNTQNVTVTWYITESQCKLKMEFSNADVNTVTYFIPNPKTGKILSYSEGALPAGTQKNIFHHTGAEH